MSNSSSFDLENAIENLHSLSQENPLTLPTLEECQVQNGTLKMRSFSTLDKTILFTKNFLLRAFSPERRKAFDEKKHQITKTLQHSLDTLKLYTSALDEMQRGNEIEKKLAKRLLQVIHSHNSYIRWVKSEKATISEKIRNYLCKIAGISLDDDLFFREIQAPHVTKVDETPSYHKFSHHSQNTTSQKISSLISFSQNSTVEEHPLLEKVEDDLFRIKAQKLLDKELMTLDGLSTIEISTLVLKAPFQKIKEKSTVTIKQTVSPLPGEEYEIKGSFERKGAFSIPLRGSFLISSSSIQTGFPDPSQLLLGLPLHNALLPNNLLRPKLSQELDTFLQEKQECAKKLLPMGVWNKKAKRLLQIKKELFNERKQYILSRYQTLISLQARSTQQEFDTSPFFSSLLLAEDPYDIFYTTHKKISTLFIAKPIEALKQEWLLKKDPRIISSDPEITMLACAEIFREQKEKARREFSIDDEKDLYGLQLGNILSDIALALFLCQIADHLSFAFFQLQPHHLFFLLLLFQSCLSFQRELASIEPEDKNAKETLFSYFEDDMEQIIVLFERKAPESHPAYFLVRAFLSYFNAIV